MRVRKAAAIGTIVACPKCNGMVLVERPAADASAPAANSDSASRSGAIGALAPAKPRDSAFDQVGDLFDDGHEGQEGDDGHQADSIVADTNESTAIEPIPAETFDDALAAAARIGEEPPLESPGPHADWTHSAMHRWRPWMLAAGAGVLGIISAIGAIRLLVEATVAADSPEVSVAQLESEATMNQPSEATSSGANNPAAQPPVVATPPEADPDVGPPTAMDAIADDESATTVDNPVANPPPTDARPTPQDQFGALIELDPQSPPNSPAEQPEEVALDPPELESLVSLDITVVNNGAQKPVDVAKRLKKGIPSIQLRRIPLHRFLELISDYSAVPMTLRWESIMHAGNTVSKTVNVDAEQSSIDQVLQRVLSPLRLTAEQNGQFVEIKKRSASPDLRITRYLVSDLVNADCSMEDLAQLVQQLVAPGTWKRQGGDGDLASDRGRLAMKQVETAHFETIMLLEQLRVARGQQPLSSYPREMFNLSDRHALLHEVLTRPVRVRAQGNSRLSELFRQVGDSVGCIILPDWTAIADAGWTMDTELEFALDELSFDEVLRQIRAVLGLTHRVLDSRTIEITSPAAEQLHVEFSMHDLQPLRDAGFDVSKLGARIQQAIGNDTYLAVGGVIAIDAASDHVIVRLPQSLQVLVRDFLTTWGA